MSAEMLFKLCTWSVLPVWILLAVAPGWRVTRWVSGSAAIPLALAAVYATLVALYFGGAEGDMDSLQGLGKLFANPWVLLAGWVHYLVFDLFVGTWIVSDARRLGFTGLWHLAIVPCLFLTLMLGPVGFLLYFVAFRWSRQQWLMPE